MAPIKFEEQIKDKLEQRTVSPSADAWSKLSQQLDAEDNRNKKSTFWWFGIAASIAVLIFVSFSYFNNDSEPSVDTIIVKDNIEDVISPNTEGVKIVDTKPEFDEELVSNSDIKKSNAVEENTLDNSYQKKEKQVEQQGILKTSVYKKQRTAIAKVDESVQEKQKITELQENKTTLNENAEVEFNSVIAVLQESKSKPKTTVTDQQIDSLLKVANRELLMDKALKNKSNIVDADALLKYAEEDLGQSFRTRVYEVLKSGFNGVKTAVANRNN